MYFSPSKIGDDIYFLTERFRSPYETKWKNFV